MSGVYAIVDHGGRSTHLVYRLETPAEPGEVQEELQIAKEASFVMSIKVRTQNPKHVYPKPLNPKPGNPKPYLCN